MIEFQVNKNDQNKRLDKFVKKIIPNAPDSFIYKLFRKKDIKVNKKPKNFDYITQLNDIVYIYISKEQQEEFSFKKDILISKKQDFTIIYEDDNVLIVNKPANLLVYDGEDKLKNEDTLTKQIHYYLLSTNQYHPENENTFIPSLAHRIDRNTSGLVVFGKTSLALQELFNAFKDHNGITKEYITLVCGKVNQSGTINAKLIKNEKTKIVNIDETHGLTAITNYQCLKNYQDVSLLNIQILTGRTHQIRVHMKSIDHPLVGDMKYGNSTSDYLAKKYGLKHYFLHARKICFHHLNGTLSYLNEKEFVAPFFKWEEDILKKLNGGNKNGN